MKFLNLSLIVLAAIFFIAPLSAIAQLADSPWPLFSGNVQHTGLSPQETGKEKKDLLWSYKTGGAVESSPTIGTDGTIYFGSWDGNFYALNPEGKELWRFDIKQGRDPKVFESKEAIASSATISADGTIYFGDIIDTFYALNLNGKEKWRYTNKEGKGFSSSPAIGSDGTVYVGAWDKKLYAFGGTSTKKDAMEQTNGKEWVLSKNRIMPVIYVIAIAIILFIIAVIIAIKRSKEHKK